MPDPRVRVTVECPRCDGTKQQVSFDGKPCPCAYCWRDTESLGFVYATPTPETAAKLADGEKWRAFADEWEYIDKGGHVVSLEQQRLWVREHAPGSVEAAIAEVVAGYAGYKLRSPTPRPSPDTEGGT